MSFTDVISLLGAIATFLFGMTTMSDGLEKLSGGRMERVLERLTSNVFRGVLLGAAVTGVIQSSSATTVMCVGFVNAGIMKLKQTVGIIMGANIGTTVTAQLLRLGDISSDSFFLQLLKPATLGPVLAIAGIILYMFLSRGRKRIVGQILLGFGLLFIGMRTMEAAVAPLQALPQFQLLFSTFSNPFFGVLVGALVTAVIQSSSASIGILQALASTGAIPFSAAFPIIMGQNIGTCITAILSSIGASKNAKRTAMIHLSFNVIGTLFFGVLLYAGNAIFQFSFWEETMSRGSIANIHLIFNLACTAVLLPFNNQLVLLAEKLVPGKSDTRDFNILDERFLVSPSVALDRSYETVVKMGEYARENYDLALGLLEHYDLKALARINETETAIDKMESLLDAYLVKLTDRSLSSEESARVSMLIHALSDYERIGDYAMNLAECAEALHERGIAFSEKAQTELHAITAAVGEVFGLSAEGFAGKNRETARMVEPVEEVVDLLQSELESRHVERLKHGECTVELGTQFIEILTNLERISDHCSNLAMYILRDTAPPGDLIRRDSHAYFAALHRGGDADYDRAYAQAKAKYFGMIGNGRNRPSLEKS